jgi:acyl carrier protein
VEAVTTEEKARRIIADQLLVNDEEVVDSANFRDDLEADSLDMVELVMQIEEAFDLQIPDEDVERIKTVGDAVKYVKERVK